MRLLQPVFGFALLALSGALPTFSQSALSHYPWQDKRVFRPFSETSTAITGSISLSGNRDFARAGTQMTIKFDGKHSTRLTEVGAAYRAFQPETDEVTTSEIFRLSADPGPLRQGNSLCGAKSSVPIYVVFLVSNSVVGSLLETVYFQSEKPPHDKHSPGLCGSYSYVLK